MRRGAIFLTSSLALALAPFLACSEKKDVASDVRSPDGGAADSGVADESRNPADGHSDAEGGARVCSVGADASTRALHVMWAPTLPTGNFLTEVQTIARSDCTVVVATVKTSESPETWSIYVEKKDTTPGSCAGPRGVRVLATGSISLPKVRATYSDADPSLFVVAYAYGARDADGGAHYYLSMGQVDWNTGDTLHTAIMATDGAAPATYGEPINLSTSTDAGFPSDRVPTPCDVVMKGFIYDRLGNIVLFPGGNPGLGPGPFFATWYHFLAPEPQEPSEADEAYIKN